DQRVNEAPPAGAPGAPAPAAPAPGAPASTTVARGSFRSLAHKTSGTATIVTLPDGVSYVRLEDFETENGPDLFVYLSPSDGRGDDDAIARNSINLGRLRGNIGDQNYRIPAGTDLSGYKSVLIWCKRFTTGFGVASLRQ
ncbi:MAG: DM13 domain-containing protein, partial [Actinomycetota bacterium]